MLQVIGRDCPVFSDVRNERGGEMTFTAMAMIFSAWLVGVLSHTGGPLIHALLLGVLAVFIFEIVRGPRSSRAETHPCRKKFSAERANSTDLLVTE